MLDIPLRPEEQLISVQDVATSSPHQPLSPLKALQLLVSVEKIEDIGKNGPLVASRAFKEHMQHSELRRYEALFGRDSLISSYFLIDQFPYLARITLLKLSELQGTSVNSASEEEPGKIVHEARATNDPIAQTLSAERGWQWPYYGSVDATPLFVKVLAAYVRQHEPEFLKQEYTDRAGQRHTLTDALVRAVEWITKKMDSNPEGLVESLRLNQVGGLINQSWKDSRDSHHHTDGTLANYKQGVASIEVQAYVYDALLDTVELLSSPSLDLQKRDMFRELVTSLTKRADKLRSLILEKFWIENEDNSYFALGSDRDNEGNIRLLKVRASNMGHILNSQLLDVDTSGILRKKNLLAQSLFSSDFLTVSGIRTLSSKEDRFRPNSYHNGSVWLWDTFYISLGLERQGFIAEARDLQKRIMTVLETTKRFPEFVSGSDASQPEMPTRTIRVVDTQYNFEHLIEQPPQEIQAWTVAVAVALENNIRSS